MPGFTLPHWLSPGDDRPSKEIDDEIAEELQLHLDLLAEERVRQGASPEEARREATERFGNFDSLVRRCRLEKQGDIPMLKRLQAVLVGILVAAVAFIGWQQWLLGAMVSANQGEISESLTAVNRTLRDIRSSVGPSPQSAGVDEFGGGYGELGPKPSSDSVTVSVIDEAGGPIRNATLLFNWTDSERNYFDFFEVETDEEGRYSTKLRYDDGKTLESVTASANGHAFVSAKLNRPGGFAEPLKLVLPESFPVRVRVRPAVAMDGSADEKNQKAVYAGYATVRPLSRIDANGQSHSAPNYGSSSAVADADGVVTVNVFAKGDSARLSLNWEGSKGIRRLGSGITNPFTIREATEEPIEVNETVGGGGGFGGGGGAF